jgi:hypothetical protein
MINERTRSTKIKRKPRKMDDDDKRERIHVLEAISLPPKRMRCRTECHPAWSESRFEDKRSPAIDDRLKANTRVLEYCLVY